MQKLTSTVINKDSLIIDSLLYLDAITSSPWQTSDSMLTTDIIMNCFGSANCSECTWWSLKQKSNRDRKMEATQMWMGVIIQCTSCIILCMNEFPMLLNMAALRANETPMISEVLSSLFKFLEIPIKMAQIKQIVVNMIFTNFIFVSINHMPNTPTNKRFELNIVKLTLVGRYIIAMNKHHKSRAENIQRNTSMTSAVDLILKIFIL